MWARTGRPELDEVVAELCAKDRFTFNQVATSVKVHEAFARYGYHIPKRPQDVRKLVMEFYEKVRKHYREEIRKLLKLKKRFSLTSDEWTSLLNKRFMNLNLHSDGQTVNLGMIPIKGSMPSEIAKELTERRLKDFGLDLNSDIVCSTTDGASVMVKYGKLLDPVLHLQCYNHALHLAVVAFLYATSVNEENEDILEDFVEEDESWDETQDDEDDASELGDTVRDLVKKVRKAVKVFRKSPVKNDTFLQKNVMADPNIGYRLNLVIDCKTR